MERFWKKRRSRRGNWIAGLVGISAILLLCSFASADWDPGNPALYYQLPDPCGWDVFSEWQYGVANDWTATQTAPITDIHFWGSWKGDRVGTTGDILMRIRSNKTQGVSFAQPGSILWESVIHETEYTSRLYTTGDQGWYDPRQSDEWYLHNHDQMYQYNINFIDNPFVQQEGQTYWLEISMDFYGCEWGWKTSLDLNGNPSVFWDTYGHHGWYWQQLKEPSGWCYPRIPNPMDVAFVLTIPEPATAFMLIAGAAILLRKRSA
jgi:hypothetical protein